jgi:hypothetical protein
VTWPTVCDRLAHRALWLAAFLACVLTFASTTHCMAADRPSWGQLAADKLRAYRENDHGARQMVLEQFGADPDPWQGTTLDAFQNPRIQRISLQACAGPGKTCIEAWCAWYFLLTQVSRDGSGFEHPKGLATSITGDNLRDNLWAELAKWQARSPLLSREFTWTGSRIFQNHHQATWFLAARSWPKTGSSDEQGRTFSGLHGKNVLILVDESGAIPPTVLRAGEQALPNTHFGCILQAGNPISHEGMLYEAAQRLAHLWFIVRVSGDPDDPEAWVHSPRVAQVAEGQQAPAEWAREQIATYGRDNPWVMAYILGKFPPSSLNTLLSLEEVVEAQGRHLQPDAYEWAQKRLGVDIARFGADRTVIFARQGLNARCTTNNPIVMRNAPTTDVAARLMLAQEKWGAELVLVDDGAMGAGVIDQMRAAGKAPYPVTFGGKAVDPRYRNRRAEMWMTMAKHIKAGAALPPIAELVAELTTPTYTFANGTFLLEEKDQVKKRLGRSPDLGDALACTYALPDMPAQLVALQRAGLDQVAGAGGNNVQIEFDPYA